MRLRRFLVPGLWEIATTAAASYTGAWLWRIQTPLDRVILYYLLWFGVMTGIFGVGAVNRHGVTGRTMQNLGLIVAIVYLGAFAALGSAARGWVWALAGLTGLASGLYWLALYAQAAHTVHSSQGAQYTAWLGVVETSAGVAVPPLTGLAIATLPGLMGYRLIFLGAAVLVCVALALSRNEPGESMKQEPVDREPASARWHLVLYSMAALGLRDGVLFFIPGLYLFVVTGRPVLLGTYLALAAAIQTLAFWVYGQRPWHPLITLATSLAGGAALWLAPPVPGIFALGLLTGAIYPAFKVPLESHALTVIQALSPSSGEGVRRTSAKELALNLGRVAGFAALWLVVVFVPHPILAMREILIGWPAIAVLLTGLLWVIRRSNEFRVHDGGL